MGLRQDSLEYINGCINDALGEMCGKRMLELGNQNIMDDSISEKTGKEYFKNRGIDHVSIDLNGLDGALSLDLTRPEQFLEWNGYFDIIMNSGTIEHIEPKNAQYECFSIIHDCLKVGGIAIHLIPDIDELIKKGCWKGHCFNYYSHDFFKMLAEKNNYKLASLKIINGLICSCLQKKKDIPFMKNREEFFRCITRRSKGIVYPGINDRGIVRLLFLITKARGKIRKMITNAIIYSSPMRRRLGLYRWWKQRK